MSDMDVFSLAKAAGLARDWINAKGEARQVTPETLRGIATWPASIALLVVSAICMFTATAYYLRLVHGWDPLSALLGASPGSMAQVMALSAEFNADLSGIAIVQVMRVLLIVIGLPAGLALFGSTVGPALTTRGMGQPSLFELVTPMPYTALQQMCERVFSKS